MNKTKTILAITLAFLGVLIFLTVSASVAKAATITVDDSGGKNYLKIQDAINASSPGDTVYVYNGTYSEQIKITKSINLVGENNQSTVIQGNGITESQGINITADYVNVSNIKVDYFYYGVYFYWGSNYSSITYNTITGCSHSAIYFSGSNNNISNNAVADSSSGIYSYTTSTYSNITSNTVTNSGCYGIYLYWSSNNNVTYNTITISGQRGICLHFYSSNNNISSNTITNCTQNGIYISFYSASNNITSNVITNNTNGVYVYYSSNNNATANNIYGNKQYGLYWDSGTGNTALNNWWGSGTGPYNSTDNPNGTGDNISGSVSFSPWATVPFNLTVETVNYPAVPTITTSSYTDTDENYVINWTASAYATNYIFYENGAQIFNGTNSTLTYTFTCKSNGTYAYKIAAWNANGTSANSTEVTLTVSIPAIVVNLPSTPSIMTNSYTDMDGNYNTNWSASNYATNYILEENSAVIFNNTNTSMTYSFTGKPDGTYIYRIMAWNANGTSSWSTVVTIVVDIAKMPSAPSITTTSYTDTDGSYSINWTSSAYATRHVLEENSIEVCNGTALTYLITGRVDGTYTYRVKAWNTNGTSSWSTSVTITVDNAKLPGTSSITTSSYTDTDGSYSINWTASTYADKYILEEDGIGIYNGTALTHSFTSKSDGTYTYRVKVWNSNGTSSWSSSVTITVDNAKLPGTPAITTSPYTDTDGNYSINWTTPNYVSKYILEENDAVIFNNTNASCTYQFASKSDGAYIYRIKTWNTNGTSSYSSTITITVDNAKFPQTPTITTLPYTDTSGRYSVNWTSSQYASKYSLEENDIEVYNGTNLTYSVSGKSDGIYTYKLKAWNVNGTSSRMPSITIIVDIAKQPGIPTITTNPYTDTDGVYAINWTASNYASKYFLRENSTEIYNGTNTTRSFAGKLDGSYTYEVYAQNINGTSSLSQAVTIIVNIAKLPRTPSITTAAYTDDNGNYYVNWTSAAYAEKYILEENGTMIFNGTSLLYPFYGKSNGTYTYMVIAWNKNGTSQRSSAVDIIVAVPDVTKPFVNITFPQKNAILAAIIVNVTGTASDNAAVQKVELSKDSMDWFLCFGTTSWYLVINFATGPNTIYVKATDTSGNYNTTNISVTEPDLVAPSISITSPATGSVLLSDLQLVKGTASDNIGVKKVELGKDGQNWSEIFGTTSTSWAWFAPFKLAEGSNTIYARATDSAGNTKTVSINVQVSTTFSADVYVTDAMKMPLYGVEITLSRPDRGSSSRPTVVFTGHTDNELGRCILNATNMQIGDMLTASSPTYGNVTIKITDKKDQYISLPGFKGTIYVQSSSGTNLTDIKIYRNGVIAGITSSTSKLAPSLTIDGLRIGDLLNATSSTYGPVQVKITKAGDQTIKPTGSKTLVLLFGSGFFKKSALDLDSITNDIWIMYNLFVDNYSISKKDIRIYVHDYQTAKPAATINGEPNKTNLEEGLKWLKNTATLEDTVLIFIVTHGSNNKTGILLTSDGTKDETVFGQWLKERVDQVAHDRMIILLAQCFSGTFIPYLAGQNHIVITAASTTLQSWCSEYDVDGDGVEKVKGVGEVEPADNLNNTKIGGYSFKDNHTIYSDSAFVRDIVDALSGKAKKADSNNDGQISIKEAYDYIKKLDATYGKEISNPQLSDVSNISSTTYLGALGMVFDWFKLPDAELFLVLPNAFSSEEISLLPQINNTGDVALDNAVISVTLAELDEGGSRQCNIVYYERFSVSAGADDIAVQNITLPNITGEGKYLLTLRLEQDGYVIDQRMYTFDVTGILQGIGQINQALGKEPVITKTNYPVRLGVPVQIPGVAAYSYDFGDGNATGWVSENMMNYSYAGEGMYYARVFIKDAYNNSKKLYSVQIIVMSELLEICLTGNVSTTKAGYVVEFEAVPIFGAASNYVFDFGDGNVSGNATSPVAEHTYQKSGIMHVTVYATSAEGETASDAMDVEIVLGNIPPRAYIDSITPSPSNIGSNVTLLGHGEDVDGSVIAYLWRSEKDGILGYEQNLTLSNLSAGSYTIFFSVKDDNGTWSQEAAKIITVASKTNIIITPKFSTPSEIIAGQEVAFDASGSVVSEGKIVLYEWDFDADGIFETNATKADIKHTYTKAKTYNVTLRVTDSDGNTAIFSQTITVKNPPSAKAGFIPGFEFIVVLALIGATVFLKRRKCSN